MLLATPGRQIAIDADLLSATPPSPPPPRPLPAPPISQAFRFGLKDVPVELYPMFVVVVAACLGGAYAVGRHCALLLPGPEGCLGRANGLIYASFSLALTRPGLIFDHSVYLDNVS